MSEIISRNREKLWLLEEKYGGVKNAAFLRDCRRLAAGEPLDYVIGWRDFLGCRIDLSERPLIPRVETEWWVEKLIFNFPSFAPASEGRQFSIFKKSPPHILDMFAGSGCVGIAVLKHVPEAYVDFADIDSSCIRQIEKNCALNGIDRRRYRTIQSDLFDNFGSAAIENNARSYYDVIFANPPYVAEATAQERVGRAVRDFEPHRALFAGADGLAVIRRFLAEAPRFLALGGVLAFEFDDTQATAVRELLALSGLKGELYPDQFGLMRYALTMPARATSKDS
jgi:release factor glutamine methyltransferase